MLRLFFSLSVFLGVHVHHRKKFIFTDMHHIPRLSEAVYVGMCRYVGSPTEVRIRREVTDTVEEVCKPVMFVRGFYRMVSGSRREGFRLQTSDIDVMLSLIHI